MPAYTIEPTITPPMVKTEHDPRWAAVLARDSSADGKFYYSVRTTGVYCRPSCASRTAKPENVRFHATREDAEQAGFRPCKRCQPDQIPLQQQQAAKIAQVCRLIEQSEARLSLEQLASGAGMSVYHFHRLFKRITGVTPQAYAATHKATQVREQLTTGCTVTEAIFEAGYGSSSRFYEKSDALLGMTPSRYRAGGLGVEIRFALGSCSLGAVLVASSNVGVCAILLGEDPEALIRDLQDCFPKAELIGGDSEYERLVAQVIGFIETPTGECNLPLDIRGTVFQQRVWQALQQIPPGTTASYSEIAQRLGMPRAVRAVASACAANSLAVAIPCHRVVRVDGNLSSYRWGVERKRELLRREAANKQDSSQQDQDDA